MPDLSSDFDKIFKSKGGLADYSKFPENQRMIDEILGTGNNFIRRMKMSNDKLPSPYFNFIQNNSINAVATKFDGNYFVGINTGTLTLIHQLFLRMLSSNSILTKWGNVGKETNTTKIHNAQITNVDTYVLVRNENENIVPNDNLRQHLAYILTYHSMNFLMMHEYAHIIMGHLDFIGNQTQSFTFSENDDSIKLDNLLIQTLEWDADSFATNIMMQEIYGSIETIDDCPEEIKSFYQNFDDNLSLCVFSIYSFFRMFGMEKFDTGKLFKFNHPPSSVRQVSILSTIHTICQSKGLDYANSVANLIMTVVIEVEQAFEEISYQGFDSSMLTLAVNPESLKHLSFMQESWKQVRPLLAPFAKANLAPA